MDTNDAINFLGNMSVIDLIALTKELETKWGVKAEPQISQVQLVPQQDTTKQEQSEFSVILTVVPADKKIAAIKLLRDITGLGLVECKSMIEKLPHPIKEGVSKQDAEGIKMKLDEVGVQSELK